jgi:hypothetical protein
MYDPATCFGVCIKPVKWPIIYMYRWSVTLLAWYRHQNRLLDHTYRWSVTLLACNLSPVYKHYLSHIILKYLISRLLLMLLLFNERLKLKYIDTSFLQRVLARWSVTLLAWYRHQNRLLDHTHRWSVTLLAWYRHQNRLLDHTYRWSDWSPMCMIQQPVLVSVSSQ